MEEAEKMVALKKAYADIILNTATEAAARVMVSERKALRFQQDTRATKDEALWMLLRLKKMLDSKTTEAEIESLGQQKRIEWLAAQLYEAEERILELRAELKKARDELDIMENPTRVEDKMCIKSSSSKDQHFKVRKTWQRTKNRCGKAKATLCRFDPKVKKPHQASPVLSRCKVSSCRGNDNVKSGGGACTSPLGKAENKNLRKNSSGLEEKVQQHKDQAFCVVRRNRRKRRVKFWDAIATSCRCLPGHLTKPCSVLSCCKNYPLNCNSESGNKIRTDADPISGSTDVNLQNKEAGASGFCGNAEDKGTEFVDEAALVKPRGDATENHRVSSCKSNHMDNKSLTDSNSKDAKTSEATSGTISQVGPKRLVKYTFSRKRKKESLAGHDENTALGKNSAKKRATEKQNGAPVPQKSSLIDESSRDSRRIVQVARQLISLSGRWLQH